MNACTQIKHQKLLYCCSHNNEDPGISRGRVETYHVEITPTMEGLKASENFALFDNSKCGQDLSERLAFGKNTQINENPWMALLNHRYNDTESFICGGSLISSRYVRLF